MIVIVIPAPLPAAGAEAGVTTFATGAGAGGAVVTEAVGVAPVEGLGGFYRWVWQRGAAGVEIPLTVARDDKLFNVNVQSVDRSELLKKPLLQ